MLALYFECQFHEVKIEASENCIIALDLFDDSVLCSEIVLQKKRQGARIVVDGSGLVREEFKGLEGLDRFESVLTHLAFTSHRKI
jgi:hypothetical protein